MDQDNRLLIITDSEIDGQDAFIINNDQDIVDILQGIGFKTFAVRSRRKNSMNENRRVGNIILKNFKDKKVDLENPDLTIYIDQVRNISYILINK